MRCQAKGFLRFLSGLLLFWLVMSEVAWAQEYYSMRFRRTNMRMGNSTDHPVLAIYWQAGTPFKILTKFYNDAGYKRLDSGVSPDDVQPSWYQVEDFEGQRGWISGNQLSSKKSKATVMVLGGDADRPVPIFAQLDDPTPIALLPKYLVMRVRICNALWCSARFRDATHGDFEGWVAREFLWGAMPGDE